MGENYAYDRNGNLTWTKEELEAAVAANPEICTPPPPTNQDNRTVHEWLTDIMKELIDATTDLMMSGGGHEGWCTNIGDPWESCSKHVAAHERREKRVKAALEALEKDA